jgi:hypothetical protein
VLAAGLHRLAGGDPALLQVWMWRHVAAGRGTCQATRAWLLGGDSRCLALCSCCLWSHTPRPPLLIHTA